MANQTQGGQQQPMMAQPVTQATIMIVQPQGESCRNNSRIVAWVDIVLGVINIVCYSLAIYFGKAEFDRIDSYNSKRSRGSDYKYTVAEKEPPVVLWAIVYLAITGVIVSCLELWTAYRLLTATSTDITAVHYQSVAKAKFWRCYHIFLIVFSFLNGAVNIGGGAYGVGGYHFVCFVIYCLCIYIVHSFIQELYRVGGGGTPVITAGGIAMAYTTSQYSVPAIPFTISTTTSESVSASNSAVPTTIYAKQ